MKKFPCTMVMLCFLLLITSNVEINVQTAAGELDKIVEINDKFEPWLWNKIQNLTLANSTKEITLIVRLEDPYGNLTKTDRTMYANMFAEKYDAEIVYVAEILPVVITKIPVEKALDVATYDYVLHIGDGDQKVELFLNVSAQVVRARPNVWNLGYRGAGINITIIDTGIDDTHPDLDDIDDDPNTNDPKVILERDFTGEGTTDDTDGHGTHVAGIAAGTGFWSINNYPANSHFIGVAPEAFLFNARVFNSTGWSQVSWIVQAIDWAVNNGADVINLSLGFTAPGDGLSELSRACDDAIDEGVVVVVAAGNEGTYIMRPGDAFNVITVGAINDHETVDISDDTLWGQSGRGPTLDNRTKPDVVAPGVSIWSTGRWSQGIAYRTGTGTSMAAPHVSGVAALLLEAHPDWTPNLVKDALKRTARLNTILQGLSENERGEGIIDAFAAVQASPDGTFGWDPYQVRSRDKAMVIYNVTRVENFPSLRNIQLYGIQIANTTVAPYLWLDSQEHKLNDTLLVSGPRIFSKTLTSADLTFVYNVNGVNIKKTYYISKTEIRSYMGGIGGDTWTAFTWLDYWDLDLHGPDHDYATWTNGSIIWNEAKLINTVFHYNNTQHFQPWIRFSFDWWGTDVTHWILRYHGGFSNNPDSYNNNESIYDTNLVIYHKSTPWEGPIIEVITQDMGLPNKSFEERDPWGSPPCSLANWSTSGGGWQDPRSDINGDGLVNVSDLIKILLVLDGTITHPDIVARADVNCDGQVNSLDLMTVLLEASAVRFCPAPKDGLYTWYTSGGGDYQMWQWLDNNTIQAVAGKTVVFSFWFYPESVAPDGTQNNARAEIYYEYDGGNNTVYGVWIDPTELDWWNPYVVADLPSNTTAIKVVIHGKPDFKAWVDLAQLYLM